MHQFKRARMLPDSDEVQRDARGKRIKERSKNGDKSQEIASKGLILTN